MDIAAFPSSVYLINRFHISRAEVCDNIQYLLSLAWSSLLKVDVFLFYNKGTELLKAWLWRWVVLGMIVSLLIGGMDKMDSDLAPLLLWCYFRICIFKHCQLSYSVVCNTLFLVLLVLDVRLHSCFCCCWCCVVHSCFGMGSYGNIQGMLFLLKCFPIKLVYCSHDFIFRQEMDLGLLFR